MSKHSFVSVRDKIKIKIGTVEATIAPLDGHQKARVNDIYGEMIDKKYGSNTRAVMAALGFCLKDIKGLQDADGNEIDYELETNEEGFLSDDCLSDLLNMEISPTLARIATGLHLHSVNSKHLKDASGEPIEGIEIVEILKGKK